MNYQKKLKPKPNFIFNNGMKKIVISVVSLSIATAGILLYTSDYNTDKINTNYGHIKNNIYSNDTLKTKMYYVAEEQEDVKTEKKNTKEDIVIKIKVPIYKKVEIRKQIIVNDSINK